MAITEKQKQNMLRYQKENLHRIPLSVSHAKYAEIKNAADRAGESVRGYILTAVDTRIQSEQEPGAGGADEE